MNMSLGTPPLAPPKLRHLASAQALAFALLKAIQRQEDAAKRKLQQSWYWGPVGCIELQAAAQARTQVASLLSPHRNRWWVPTPLLVRQCHTNLLQAAASWRANPIDEDGYGMATAHAIRRTLEA